MKSVLKPFPSRRLSKMKFFYWEPTAANKPTIYLATESKGGREEGRCMGSGRKGGGGGEGLASFLPSLFCRKGVISFLGKGGTGCHIRQCSGPGGGARPPPRLVLVLVCLRLARAPTALLGTAGKLRQPPGLSGFYSLFPHPSLLHGPIGPCLAHSVWPH